MSSFTWQKEETNQRVAINATRDAAVQLSEEQDATETIKDLFNTAVRLTSYINKALDSLTSEHYPE